MNINLHIYPSHFQFESRIVKQTMSIANEEIFDQIIILAFWKEGLQTEQVIDESRKVIRIKTFFEERAKGNKILKLFAFIELFVKSILYFRQYDLSLINCHSLTVLPLSVVMKWFHGSKLCYDTHELETERNGLHGIRQKLEAFVESSLIGNVDGLSVVGPSILNWYLKRYNWKKPYCSIRNIPEIIEINKPKEKFREKFSIQETSIVFLYQGLVAKGRGILEIIEAFKRIEKNHHLIIMGYGPMKEDVLSLVNENIHWYDAVPQYEVLAYTSQADVGLSLGENVCLSYYYSLPNKMFEYIKCGVPVLSSNFPDMIDVVEQFNCGWNIEPRSEEIYNFISSIEIDEIKIKRDNTLLAGNELDWNKEVKGYLNLIKEILN